MVSTYTTNKDLEKPAYNDYVDDWNTPVNGNSDFIDSAFGGSTSLNATAASGTVTLTAAQYRTPILLISGTLTANVNYQIPSGKGGLWAVYNNTTGSFTITISSAGGGTTVVIPQTSRQIVYCDGTNVAAAQNFAPGVTTNVAYNNGGVLAGSNTFVFDGTNVGINTTAPGSHLDVKGTIRLSGSTSGHVGLAPAAEAGSTTYTLPTNDGSNGQNLTTNGSGILSWTSAAAGVGSFSAGTTGLTPSTATTGDITLDGTLAIANGGTASTTASDARTALGVPYANSAEVAAGTEAAKVISPSSFAGNASASSNGYYTLPGGVKIQWGSATITSTGTVTFPVAFSTACWSFVASVLTSSSSGTPATGTTQNVKVVNPTSAPTTTSVGVVVRGEEGDQDTFQSGNASTTIYWIAIGS